MTLQGLYGGGMRPRSGICPICQVNSLLTEEDVIPKWLRAVQRTSLNIKVLPPKTIIMICANCNSNRLGRIFENRASPLIKRMLAGDRFLLSRRDQAIVAAWCVKTDLLLSLFRDDVWIPSGPRKKSQYYVDRDLKHLRMMLNSNGAIGDGWFVRVGAVGGSLIPPSRIPLVPSGWPRGQCTYLTSVNILGSVFTETIWVHGHEQAALQAALRPDPRMIQIWPPKTAMAQWPPNEITSPVNARILRTEWGHDPANILHQA
jgi:hypothetical protein